MDPVLFHNSEEGRKAFVDLASRAVQWISDYYKNIESYPVRSKVMPGDIYKQLPVEPATLPVSDDDVFKILDEVIIPGMTHWQHPDFFAFFPGNTSFPSIVAEMITAGISFDKSPNEPRPREHIINEKQQNMFAGTVKL